MSNNCKIQLKGNLGQDPKTITGEKGKEFVALSIATTDSFMDKETKAWKNKETQWHDVLIFRPSTQKFAKDLKKGDCVYIDGVLSYKQIDGKDGYKIAQALIIANFVAKAPLVEKDEQEGAEQ